MIRNDLEDFKVGSGKLSGLYRGVIEDRAPTDSDGNALFGKVRIRVWGVHSDKTEKDDSGGIPKDELPLASMAQPIMFGGSSGLGMSSVPQQGTHVLVWFEDGHPMNPVCIAMLPGTPEEPSSGEGKAFEDPDGVYPLEHKTGNHDACDPLAQGVNYANSWIYKRVKSWLGL